MRLKIEKHRKDLKNLTFSLFSHYSDALVYYPFFGIYLEHQALCAVTALLLQQPTTDDHDNHVGIQ